jgi:hypothetical protein
MTELISESTFRLLITIGTGGLGVVWVVHDVLFLSRLRGKDLRDPLLRDQRFGYVMGIVIAVIGVVGMLRFNGVV